MMRMNKVQFSVMLFFSISTILAQSEGLTSSPYSLYGLGTINQSGIGKTNGMGYVGIGLKTPEEINNINTANFALVPQNLFIYDVGLKGLYNTFSNRADQETKTTLNFSNLAVAFRIGQGLGAGLSLVPYSDVGYSLVGIKTNIEGSNETFESSVTGVGGLSDLKLNLGYELLPGLRLGLGGSLLFGNIEETETFEISSSNFELTENTNYTGFRLNTGIQFDVSENITLGSTIQLPTSLKGTLKRSVLKNVDQTEITVENEGTDSTDDFKMPLQVGLGFSAKIFKSLTLAGDYKNNYWSDTQQTENLGSYVDQSVFALGMEYEKNSDSFKYVDRIQYRLGYNYDTGYLSMNGSKIDGYSFTAGIGLPVGQGWKSRLNLSYSYGSQGQIQNIMIKENFHLVTLNLGLKDVWFQKRKIN
ncbi:hypothetical protein BIZ36_01805 [Cytophaga sp. FL35]|nr:hypothetical protein [Cytophaga sp. FL35]